MRILAIDPGRVKFGYAVLTAGDRRVLSQGVAEVAQLVRVGQELVDRFQVTTVVIGDRTAGPQFAAILREGLKDHPLDLVLVGEDGSSREGRHRFLQANRRGWRRWFPLGLQSPWRPYDDYVAVVLGERYLDRCRR
ncbi:MAG: pre-16S rRNA-processing nuclease YqgF [Firmicutes bacterium]|nr:pre-16S rRNA-processing nuclease YqgF [Bacillota bacterium]